MSGLDQKEIQRSLENTGNDGKDLATSLSELLQTLSDEEQYILFSELTDREINHLSVISTVGHNDEVTSRFVQNFMQMKVSKNRKGRKELANISEAFAQVHQTENEGSLSKLKNKLGGVL